MRPYPVDLINRYRQDKMSRRLFYGTANEKKKSLNFLRAIKGAFVPSYQVFKFR